MGCILTPWPVSRNAGTRLGHCARHEEEESGEEIAAGVNP